MTEIPEEDLRFGEMVVAQGICTRARLDECFDLLRRLRETGASPLPRIGEVLVRKGYLSVGDSVRLGVEPSLPGEVVSAAGDPRNHVGKYVRVASLGSGAMGEVWRAWDRELRRWVALKFLRESARAELDRFRQEAQTVAKLNHPNIAAVYETGEAQGQPYIVMQYVAGRTVSAISSKDRRLAARIVRDAAAAVHYAHEQGVVHRDLKPQNLMVEMQPFRVYVMDFGLAKRMAVDASVSVSGSIVGTPNYMSPEQARGKTEEVGPRSDLYSLGATLYEMLTERRPFAHGDILETLRKVAEEDLVPIRRIDSGVDRDLETVVMKCLEKNPSRRYPSASALAKDLTRWLDGDAIAAHPPSLTYRVVKKLSKRKTLVAMVAGVLLASLAVGGGIWIRLLGEARGWVRQARDRAAEGRYEEAKRLLDQARARIAVDEELYRLCSEKLEEPRRRAEEKEARDRRVRAALDELEGLPPTEEGARNGLRIAAEALLRDPDSDALRIWKGQMHVRLSEPEEALEEYRKACEANPLSAQAHYVRGTVLHATGRDRKAIIDAFVAAQGAEPESEWAKLAVIRVALLEGEGRNAIEACRELEGSVRNRQELYLLRGTAHTLPQGGCFDWDEAIRQFTEAVRCSPDPSVYFCRAWAYRARSEISPPARAAVEREQAIADCTAALKCSDRFRKAWQLRSLLYEATGRIERAIDDSGRAIELEPGDPREYARRATLRWKAGDVPGVIADLKEALRRAPADWPDRGKTEELLDRAKGERKQ